MSLRLTTHRPELVPHPPATQRVGLHGSLRATQDEPALQEGLTQHVGALKVQPCGHLSSDIRRQQDTIQEPQGPFPSDRLPDSEGA